MAEPKTKPTDRSVTDFLLEIPEEQRRQDCFTVLELMKEVTGTEPVMWASNIVGLGIHRKYDKGAACFSWQGNCHPQQAGSLRNRADSPPPCALLSLCTWQSYNFAAS